MDLLSFFFKGAETGLSLLANYNSAETAETAGDFNAQIARQNAERERQNADYIRRTTEIQIDSVRRKASQTEGTQRAGFGASGVSASAGSAVDVYTDTAKQAALDVEILRHEGEYQASIAEQSAADYDTQADIEGWKGKKTSTGFQLQAGASLLKGAGDMYDMWKKRGD